MTLAHAVATGATVVLDAQVARLRDEVDGLIAGLATVEGQAKTKYLQEVPLLQAELGRNRDRIRALQHANRAVEQDRRAAQRVPCRKEKRRGAEKSFGRTGPASDWDAGQDLEPIAANQDVEEDAAEDAAGPDAEESAADSDVADLSDTVRIHSSSATWS